MSEETHNAETSDPMTQPFLDLWSSYVHHADRMTKTMLGGMHSGPDAEAARRRWFAELERQADAFLRTPAFLQTMQSQLETLAQGAGRTAQAEQQVEALAARLQEIDESMQYRLEQLEARLAALEVAESEPHESGTAARSRDSDCVRAIDATEFHGSTDYDVVHEQGTMRLLHYCGAQAKYAEPVLICYALVNRPYILDLQPHRSVVRRLRNAGLEVYLIDWGVPTVTDHTLQLEDYVCRFLRDAVEFVCNTTGAGQLTLLGYCMGGTMSTLFTALHPDRVRNLVLLATPIDFAQGEGLLRLWSREEHFDVDQLIDACGNCPGEFLRSCFQLMKPVQNFAEKYALLCDKLNDGSYADDFLAMERWTNDSIPVAGETFREFVKWLYQQNRLVRGELTLAKRPVRLESITCPLLLLVAEQDHLVPPESALAIQDYVQSTEIVCKSIPAGHIGLAVSSKAHSRLWPEAARWIGEHSTKRQREALP